MGLSFFGSILPPFLFGVLFASILRGMPIDADMNLHAGFTDYVNVYSVTGESPLRFSACCTA